MAARSLGFSSFASVLFAEATKKTMAVACRFLSLDIQNPTTEVSKVPLFASSRLRQLYSWRFFHGQPRRREGGAKRRMRGGAGLEEYSRFESLIPKLGAAPHPAASPPPSPRFAGRGDSRSAGRHAAARSRRSFIAFAAMA